MANAQVVITGSNAETPNIGKIFDGISFFLVQRMPSRSRFVKDIETNGGTVVRIESQADYVIADHVRKDAPAGSYSYTLIEAALRDGQIPDPPEHAIRPPDAVREVGSTSMGKATRVPFTVEDDKFLWNWVEQAKAQSERPRGNEIYKRLEIVNPRHTFQSWRDRYIKYLSVRPPAGVTVPANPPPSPPVTSAEDVVAHTSQGHKAFTQEDFDKLMANADDIEVITGEQWDKAWVAFANAESDSGHTAEEWSSFWQLHVLPVHLKKSLTEKKSDVKTTIESEPDDLETADQESVTGDKKRKMNMEQEVDSPDRTKRQKTARSETSGNDNRDNKVRGDLGNVQAEQPLQRADDVVEIPRETAPEPVITSDLNAAATLQLEHEAKVDNVDPSYTSPIDGRHFQNMELPRFDAELPTSNANRAAEAQSLVLRASDVTGGKTSDDAMDDIREPPTDEIASATASGSQFALTAENLASQQAQHEPPVIRGTDLPKDDEDADQTPLIEYLQGLERREAKDAEAIKSSLARPAEEHEVNEERSRDTEPYHTPPGQAEPKAQLPLSSPREIDDVFEAGLNWPASPTQTNRQPAWIRQNPEPLVTYPQLPSQIGSFTSRVDESFEEPAETLMSQLDRPTSSNRRGSGHRQDFDDIFNDEHDVEDNEENVDGDGDDLDDNEEEHAGGGVIANGHEGQVHFQRSRWFGDEVEDFDDAESEDQSQQDWHTEDGKEKDDYDDIDLEVVEPEGGFENGESLSPNQEISEHDDAVDEQDVAPQIPHVVEISSDESSSILSESPERSPHPSMADRRTSHAVDTQDIINAETQKPDLEMALPPSSDDDLEESFTGPSHRMPPQDKGKSKATETESLDTPEQVNGWVSTMVVRGYKKGAVVKALKRTSLKPDLALLVLIEQKAGKGVPTDVSGVWSLDDDELLESGDARGLRELEKKHGWEEMDSRMKFLEAWRALG